MAKGDNDQKRTDVEIRNPKEWQFRSIRRLEKKCYFATSEKGHQKNKSNQTTHIKLFSNTLKVAKGDNDQKRTDVEIRNSKEWQFRSTRRLEKKMLFCDIRKRTSKKQIKPNYAYQVVLKHIKSGKRRQ